MHDDGEENGEKVAEQTVAFVRGAPKMHNSRRANHEVRFEQKLLSVW